MKIFFKILVLLIISMQLAAQPAERYIRVQVAPDHSTFLYKEGEPVKFNISVMKNSIPVKDMEIRYDISEDMMKPHKSAKLTLKDGMATIDAGTMKKAGFLRCQVYATYNGREYDGLATVGFSPQTIQPVTPLPSDFVEFWDKVKADAANVPLDVKMTLVPERCSDKLNIYHVNIQNFETGSRIYGMLSVPKGGGKYPAVLKVPGAGIRAYNGDTENASQGYIVFEIGVHGIPVNLPNDVYTNLYQGALKQYYSMNLDNRDNFYYKRVYMGCVRAIDLIYTLPEFDGENLIVYGGSQGGALSIVTAALDNRVKALVSFYPALCDLVGYLHGRAGGWPHMFKKEENNKPDKIATAQYYDVVNFARQIKIPGHYCFGYNDMVCPPTTVYSALNMIQAPKDIFITEDTRHYIYPEQWKDSWVWIKNFLRK